MTIESLLSTHYTIFLNDIGCIKVFVSNLPVRMHTHNVMRLLTVNTSDGKTAKTSWTRRGETAFKFRDETETGQH